MRVIYRLDFGLGQGYVENSDLEILQASQRDLGGSIEAYQIEVHVMKGDVKLGTFDTADEADPVCEDYKQQAMAEIAQQFHVNPVKTRLDPQPDGLNN